MLTLYQVKTPVHTLSITHTPLPAVLNQTDQSVTGVQVREVKRLTVSSLHTGQAVQKEPGRG